MTLPEIPRQSRARRQIRRVTLDVEAHEDGTYVVTTPQARGWRRRVRTNPEAGAVLHEALVEAQIAAYSLAHGQVYDHDAATDVDPDTPATHHPQARPRGHAKGSRVSSGWEEQEDGTWKSPAGMTFGADTQVVRRVVAARERERARREAETPPHTLPPDRG